MKKSQFIQLILDLFTLFVIPIYTIILASYADWLATNLSVIGNYFDKQLAFFIWGTTIGLYFYLYLRHLFSLVRYRNNFVNLILFLSCFLIFAAVSTPYLPEKFPLKSFLHIMFAFLSPLALLLAVSFFVYYLWKKDSRLYLQSILFLTFITLTSAALLHMVGFVSSLLEIFITISTAFFIRDLHKKIIKDYII